MIFAKIAPRSCTSTGYRNATESGIVPDEPISRSAERFEMWHPATNKSASANLLEQADFLFNRVDRYCAAALGLTNIWR